MFWFLKSKKAKAKNKVMPKRKAKKLASKKAKPSVKAEKLVAVGEITGYFKVPKAAVIKLKKDSIKVGDEIVIRGHTTDFKQKVASLQIDREPIKVAKKGAEFGLKVKKKVRRGDQVYKKSL